MVVSRFGAFTLRTECARCGQPVPVNTPSPRAHCGACQSETAIPSSVWATLLITLDDEHDAMAEGATQRLSSTIDGLIVHYSYARVAPRCGKCSGALPVDVPAETERDVACPGCGARVHAYPVPDWLRTANPNARQVYATDGGPRSSGAAEAPTAVAAAVQPVMMPCPQCGGGLSIGPDGERVMKCHYCASDVFIPDALWLRLHPPRTTDEWFVRFEGETRAERQKHIVADALARMEREEDAAREARRVEIEARRVEDEGKQQALDADVAKACRDARAAVAVASAVMGAATLWNVGAALKSGLDDARAPVGVALLVLTILASLWAVHKVVRPIVLRTAPDPMVFPIAFWSALAVLAVPIFGAIFVPRHPQHPGPGSTLGVGILFVAMGVVASFAIGAWRFLATQVGGYMVTADGKKTIYPETSLQHGEGKAAGALFFVLASLYPAVVFTLFFLGIFLPVESPYIGF